MQLKHILNIMFGGMEFLTNKARKRESEIRQLKCF